MQIGFQDMIFVVYLFFKSNVVALLFFFLYVFIISLNLDCKPVVYQTLIGILSLLRSLPIFDVF